MDRPPTPSAEQHPGSLCEWLRGRSDTELGQLLRRRPDLALPAPADLAALASRMSVRSSVQRAVDELDAPTLHVLEALVLSAPSGRSASVADAAALLGDPAPEVIERALEALRELGLVWGDGSRVHLVSTVRDVLGPYPAGLGRPAAQLLRQVPDPALAPALDSLGLPRCGQPRAGEQIAAALEDPDTVGALIEASDTAERKVLERLADGPPVGVVRNATQPGHEPSPAHQLLARGLLVATGAREVELPREVALALREVPLGRIEAEPPAWEVTERTPDELDRIGTTAVLETLRLVDALADAWTAHPPHQLRSGGVGARDLRRSARELDIDQGQLALVIETASAAGLFNATTDPEPVVLPTGEYDAWSQREPTQRWSELALAWLQMTRQPSLVNERGDRDRLITVLSPDAERGTVPALRERVLRVLAGLPPGAAVSSTDLLDRLTWLAPRRAARERDLAAAVLAEADSLGVTAAGGLTGYSRTLRSGSRAVAEQVLADALPEPVDYFLVQPDLTVVVPGPPTRELARELALMAELESTGGAYVYRITEASVRGALDAGRSGAQLAALIEQRSRTPEPQSLRYLIDDAARRHGQLRAGAAGAYLRCDDEALLERVLANRDVASLQLRRIAPTIVICSASINRVVHVLREAGYAPAAESPDGELVSLQADRPRAPSRTTPRSARSHTNTDEVRTAQLVRRIRSGESLTQVSRHVTPVSQHVPGTTSAATMGVLRDAIRQGRRVLLGCAEPDGTATRHTILPISMAGGFVRGHAPDAQGLQSFPLHRLTAVSVLDDEDEAG